MALGNDHGGKKKSSSATYRGASVKNRSTRFRLNSLISENDGRRTLFAIKHATSPGNSDTMIDVDRHGMVRYF